MYMKNTNLEIAVYDLVGAIKQICLGSIEYVVINDSVISLIYNWNSHNADIKIDVVNETNNWNRIKDEIINQ